MVDQPVCHLEPTWTYPHPTLMVIVKGMLCSTTFYYADLHQTLHWLKYSNLGSLILSYFSLSYNHNFIRNLRLIVSELYCFG